MTDDGLQGHARSSGPLVLFNPCSNAGRKPVLPMSLLAIGALLEGERDYSIVDGTLDRSVEQTLRAKLSGGPRPILAVTVMPGPQLEQAVPVCRQLKEEFPDLVVVWGGYFPSQHWRACLASGWLDCVVRGHADLAFAELVRCLGVGLSPAQCAERVPGLAWRDERGEVHTNALPPIPRPAELPHWNLARVDVPSYLRKTFLGERTIGYNSSYGCPFFCNFCAVVNLVNGKWLAEPGERVADAVRTYRDRWDVDAVEFVDNNFFTQEKRVARFAEEVLDLGVSWWGEGRIDTILGYSDATWEVMRDSGLRMIFLGAESGSDETLKRMDKGGRMSVAKTLEMVETMKRWDIVPELSFVLGNPPDPEADMRATLSLVKKVKRINPKTEIILYQYTPVPLDGSFFDEARDTGFDFPESLEEWVSDEWREFSLRRDRRKLPWVERRQHSRLKNFERVLNAYYPTSTMPSLKGARRVMLRGLSSWRYWTGFHHAPYELALAQRLLRYQRPETTGF